MVKNYSNILDFYPKTLLGIVLLCISINVSFLIGQPRSGILERQPEFTSQQRILGDTLQKDTSIVSGSFLPGGTSATFSPYQDSAYFSDLRISIPVASRVEFSLNLHARRLHSLLEAQRKGGIYAAQENLATIPNELLIPSPVEKVLYETNLQMAQTVRFVTSPSTTGLRIPISDIASFFGLSEDVSPVIKYSLDYAAEVQIVIYSVNAAVVAVLFEGVQPSGNYSIAWNGRDDKGRKMPSGDYIAEVRIADLKFIRKRILIP